MAVTRTTRTIRGDKFLTFRFSTNLSPAIFRIKDSRFAGKTDETFPSPTGKESSNICRSSCSRALSGEKFSPRIPKSDPSLPFFNFFQRDIVERKRRQERVRTRGGWEEAAWLELTVKGRENCARWPFENTMEINLSSLTNLRGHKATEDRGNCFNYNSVRSRISFSLRDSRKKKRKTEILLTKFPPLAPLSVRDDLSLSLSEGSPPPPPPPYIFVAN